MSIRPLDLAQNIQNQSLQAQQKQGELAAERGQATAQEVAEKEEALLQLAQVQHQHETEGKVIREESQRGQGGEHAHQEHPENAPGHHAEHHPIHHADETAEGKGLALDIDV